MTERLYIAGASEPGRTKAPRVDGRRQAGRLGTPALRSGDPVTVRVVKHLSGRKWAVALEGRLFPAVAETPLKPGRSFTAFVNSRSDSSYSPC